MQKVNIDRKFLIGALSATLLFASCTNLETNEIDSFVPESSGGGLNPGTLLTSIYESDMGALTDQQNMYALSEHTTDEMIPPTRGVDWGDNGVWRSLHQHSWDPTHQHVVGSWNQLNERVFKCTQILSASPSSDQAAQAKFLRAFFMYQVMDLYGQVPFREANEGVSVNPKVFTRAEAFNFVVKDLEEALPGLSDAGPKAENYIPTKAAANTLLARLYLNKAVYTAPTPEGPYTFEAADMNKVIAHADAVTASGYSLEEEYFTNFTTEASKEIILTSKAGSAQNRYFMTLHYNQNPSGWNGFTTLADFYAKFEDGDERRGFGPGTEGYQFNAADFPADNTDLDNDEDTDEPRPYNGLGKGFLIGQQYEDSGEPLIDTRSQQPLVFTPDVPLSGAATNKGIRVIKYHPEDDGQYVLIRYADVVLMKAEAIVRGGTPTGGETALSIVNNLRETRNASPLASVDESTVLDERGRELYWEGLRRTDQIRFGTFTTTWTEKPSTEKHRVLFPIPQQALDSNPNLKQNEGY